MRVALHGDACVHQKSSADWEIAIGLKLHNPALQLAVVEEFQVFLPEAIDGVAVSIRDMKGEAHFIHRNNKSEWFLGAGSLRGGLRCAAPGQHEQHKECDADLGCVDAHAWDLKGRLARHRRVSRLFKPATDHGRMDAGPAAQLA